MRSVGQDAQHKQSTVLKSAWVISVCYILIGKYCSGTSHFNCSCKQLWWMSEFARLWDTWHDAVCMSPICLTHLSLSCTFQSQSNPLISDKKPLKASRFLKVHRTFTGFCRSYLPTVRETSRIDLNQFHFSSVGI